MEKRPKTLLDQVRETIRVKHYSIRIEQAYVAWIRRFILFHDKRHPREMGTLEIEAFLTHLAVDRNVAASESRGARGDWVLIGDAPVDGEIALRQRLEADGMYTPARQRR